MLTPLISERASFEFLIAHNFLNKHFFFQNNEKKTRVQFFPTTATTTRMSKTRTTTMMTTAMTTTSMTTTAATTSTTKDVGWKKCSRLKDSRKKESQTHKKIQKIKKSSLWELIKFFLCVDWHWWKTLDRIQRLVTWEFVEIGGFCCYLESTNNEKNCFEMAT